MAILLFPLNSIISYNDDLSNKINYLEKLVTILNRDKNWKEYHYQAGQLKAYKEVKQSIDRIINVSEIINDCD